MGAWCETGTELQDEQTLVIAGELADIENVVLVRPGEATEMTKLYSDHEEADT